MKKKLLLGLFAFHVSILLFGMVRHLVKKPELKKIVHSGDVFVDLYEVTTGAGGGFGFFSPNIGNQFLVRFQVDGQSEPVEWKDLVTHEVAIRAINMNRFFVQRYENEKAKRAIASSLSAYVFGRYPHARGMEFIVDFYKLPTLKEYGLGARPSTKEVYRARFNLEARL